MSYGTNVTKREDKTRVNIVILNDTSVTNIMNNKPN